jgi:hypothetical protein
MSITDHLQHWPRYRPKYRPAGYATLPSGIYWHYVEAPADGSRPGLMGVPTSRHCYGVIATNRALSAEECSTFDLEPVT